VYPNGRKDTRRPVGAVHPGVHRVGEGMSKLSSLKPKVSTIDTRTCSTPITTERIRGYQLQKIREETALDAEYICQSCGRVTGMKHGEVDHKVPLHLGGAESSQNRQWLCRDCHRKKTEQEEKDRGSG